MVDKITWHSELRPIDCLHGWKDNPRQITDKGLNQLKRSIGKFGLAEPVVIQPDGTIVGGHARLLALADKGISEVDCYVPNRQLTSQEYKELNVRLNKNVAGEWDFDKLANCFELNDLMDWGFEPFELGIDVQMNADSVDDEENKNDKKEVVCPECGCKFKQG